MKKIEIIDQYNNNKKWIIKKYANSNFYFNQINGKNKLNTSFKRVTKKFLINILGVKFGGFKN